MIFRKNKNPESSQKSGKTYIKKTIIILLILCILAALAVFSLDLIVTRSTKDQIVTEFHDTYDCILVLGAGVRNGSPRPMLKDRLDYAIKLYKNGVAPKLLMSGDHGRIAEFRKSEAEKVTRERRPDLWKKYLQTEMKEV